MCDNKGSDFWKGLLLFGIGAAAGYFVGKKLEFVVGNDGGRKCCCEDDCCCDDEFGCEDDCCDCCEEAADASETEETSAPDAE